MSSIPRFAYLAAAATIATIGYFLRKPIASALRIFSSTPALPPPRPLAGRAESPSPPSIASPERSRADISSRVAQIRGMLENVDESLWSRNILTISRSEQIKPLLRPSSDLEIGCWNPVWPIPRALSGTLASDLVRIHVGPRITTEVTEKTARATQLMAILRKSGATVEQDSARGYLILSVNHLAQALTTLEGALPAPMGATLGAAGAAPSPLAPIPAPMGATLGAAGASPSPISGLGRGMPLPALQTYLRDLPPAFVRTSDTISSAQVLEYHEQAKAELRDALAATDLGRVEYVTAEPRPLSGPLPTTLDPSIFHWSATEGVQDDIPRAARNRNQVHLWMLASQCNGTEAPEPLTPAPGDVMRASATDRTQGPLAQRTNPRLFELVNAFLGNRGFNMLARVLPPATTVAAMQHGYLILSSTNLSHIARNFTTHWQQAEYPCVESPLPEGPAYLMMAAAPALGIYSPGLTSIEYTSQPMRDVQYHSALANFTAQFKQVRALMDRHPNKGVVYHPCAVGLGVFGNNPSIVGQAFLAAAQVFQAQLTPAQKQRVKVQFEVFRGTDEGARTVATTAGIQQRSRVE